MGPMGLEVKDEQRVRRRLRCRRHLSGADRHYDLQEHKVERVLKGYLRRDTSTRKVARKFSLRYVCYGMLSVLLKIYMLPM
jgi:hypothetical protein